jgi:uncharacterized membrane protein
VITGRIAGVGIALGGVMIASLLAFVLSIPVIMATWFAPALVFFHNMQPLAAMKASLAAGVKNWLAMLVFSLLLAVAMFFAALPFFVGFLLLTLRPRGPYAILLVNGEQGSAKSTAALFIRLLVALPFFVGFLVLIPLFTGAIYVSYLDIFEGA